METQILRNCLRRSRGLSRSKTCGVGGKSQTQRRLRFKSKHHLPQNLGRSGEVSLCSLLALNCFDEACPH